MTMRTYLNGSSVSDWTVAGNWSGGVLPGPTDAVAFTQTFAGTEYVVSIDDSETVGSVLLDAANAQLSISGPVTLTTNTFDLRSGLLSLTQLGTLKDAVLVADGGTLFAQDGVLDGVTVQGLLELALNANAPPTFLEIRTSSTLRDASGTGPGQMDVLSPNAFVQFEDSETIDGTGLPGDNGVLITLGGDNEHLNIVHGATLTLGAHATVRQTGSGTVVLDGGGTIVNDGHIEFAGGGGFIGALAFTNAGVIDIAGAEQAFMGGGTQQLSNTGLIALSGGSTLQRRATLAAAERSRWRRPARSWWAIADRPCRVAICPAA